MKLGFRPNHAFLEPYVGVADYAGYLPAEFWISLDENLEAAGFRRVEVLATRAASEAMDPAVKVKLKGAEEKIKDSESTWLEGNDVLVEIAEHF